MKMRVASDGWDSNPRQSVLHALPTELPRQPSWQGPNQTSHTTACMLGLHLLFQNNLKNNFRNNWGKIITT